MMKQASIPQRRDRKRQLLWWPIVGVLAAIAITTTMDATGLSAFSALPLFPLIVVFWWLQGFSRHDMGFAWGQWHHYGLALLYPLLVLGIVAVIAIGGGVADLSHTNWHKAELNFLLVAVSTFVVAILTEEGFFRGWFWAALGRVGAGPTGLLVWSSLAFALWHLSAVTLETGFNPPASQVPVFMINAAVMGAIWSLLRLISGSVIVASLSHGVWNAGAYVFFGLGTKVGALGVRNTGMYGPEVGVLGLAINLLFFLTLCWWTYRRLPSHTPARFSA